MVNSSNSVAYLHLLFVASNGIKTISLVIMTLFITSCSQSNQKYSGEKYIVETTVQLKEGTTEKVLSLFKSTNPELVRSESDWLRASFSSLENENIVVVRAEWKNKESYSNFANSKRFKKTMVEFGKYFEQKPDVRITKVLFEM